MREPTVREPATHLERNQLRSFLSNSLPCRLEKTQKYKRGNNMRDIFKKARATQKIWQQTSFKTRAQSLEKMRLYIFEHYRHIVDTISLDTKKTNVDALAAEVIPCTLACRWYANHAEKHLKPKKIKNSHFFFLNKSSVMERKPLGVVGIISPWNYPLSLPFSEILMGLVAGNAVIFKGDPRTPRVNSMIEKIIQAGELPEGLFHSITGDGAEIAKSFFENKIDKIFFTGSTRVGRLLMMQAAENITPLSLELGGKDPMIVLADADLERASNGAIWGGYQNAGQTCAGIERIYVDEKIYDKFIALLTKKTKALCHGDYGSQKVDIGGITTSEQLKVITSQVEEAVAQGARIIAQSNFKGNQLRSFPLNPSLLESPSKPSKEEGLGENCAAGFSQEKNYFPATLVVDVNHSMRLMKEETFGPVLTVMKFKTTEEALTLANDSPYALTASIWTSDIKKGRKLAVQLAAGVVTLNDHLYTHAMPEIPWGGVKTSGMGRTHGKEGLEEMTTAQVVSWERLGAKRNIFWYPTSDGTFKSLEDLLKLLNEKSTVSRWGYGLKVIPFLYKKMFSSWEV